MTRDSHITKFSVLIIVQYNCTLKLTLVLLKAGINVKGVRSTLDMFGTA
jgi:hypothetical protein